MHKGRTILKSRQFELTIERLCHQLIEQYSDFDDCCIIGVQPRGVQLADRIHAGLLKILKKKSLEYGKLDITFYRDDFRTRTKPLAASHTELNFIVEDKNVVLIDDVLYTGRTIQAALSALQHYGRPRRVELLAMVDRRFNRHLPIQADYIGLTVDSLDDAFVKVEWKESDGADKIILYTDKK